MSALRSSLCLSAHTSGVWIHMAAASLTMLRWALDPHDQTAHLPVFLHLRTTNLPGPDSIMCSEHAQQRRMERNPFAKKTHMIATLSVKVM